MGRRSAAVSGKFTGRSMSSAECILDVSQTRFSTYLIWRRNCHASQLIPNLYPNICSPVSACLPLRFLTYFFSIAMYIIHLSPSVEPLVHRRSRRYSKSPGEGGQASLCPNIWATPVDDGMALPYLMTTIKSSYRGTRFQTTHVGGCSAVTRYHC